jgi:putative sterol carrier protein
MAVKFLSQDWIDAVNVKLAADADFSAQTAATDVSLQFEVMEAPEGDVHYSATLKEGGATFALGNLEGADAIVRNSYETAAAISKGELNTQAAFIGGKLKVEGNLAKIMMNQAAFTALAEALKDLEIEY